MTDKGLKGNISHWWPLPAVMLVAIVLAFVCIVLNSSDSAAFSIFFGVIPLLVVVLLTLAIGRKGCMRFVSLVLLLVSIGAASFLASNFLELRTTARWLLQSQKYKAQVFALSNPSDGYLRHVESDGWGFPGAGDTIVYLVFDPNNSLLAATQSRAAAKISGIPCVVPRVGRIENQWYFVVFYTGTDWDHCDSVSAINLVPLRSQRQVAAPNNSSRSRFAARVNSGVGRKIYDRANAEPDRHRWVSRVLGGAA